MQRSSNSIVHELVECKYWRVKIRLDGLKLSNYEREPGEVR